MNRTVFAALAAVALNTLAAPVMAGNAGESLGACYNHVISACNQTNHPESCSNAGMDACDEYHTAQLNTEDPLSIKIFAMGGGRYLAKLEQPRQPRDDDDTRTTDRDHADERRAAYD